jgi:hypothetical protein
VNPTIFVLCDVNAIIIFLRKIKKKHLTREEEKKKERTKVQTKDHTPKCR